jgi:hypothetical protein
MNGISPGGPFEITNCDLKEHDLIYPGASRCKVVGLAPASMCHQTPPPVPLALHSGSEAARLPPGLGLGQGTRDARAEAYWNVRRRRAAAKCDAEPSPETGGAIHLRGWGAGAKRGRPTARRAGRTARRGPGKDAREGLRSKVFQTGRAGWTSNRAQRGGRPGRLSEDLGLAAISRPAGMSERPSRPCRAAPLRAP